MFRFRRSREIIGVAAFIVILLLLNLANKHVYQPSSSDIHKKAQAQAIIKQSQEQEANHDSDRPRLPNFANHEEIGSELDKKPLVPPKEKSRVLSDEKPLLVDADDDLASTKNVFDKQLDSPTHDAKSKAQTRTFSDTFLKVHDTATTSHIIKPTAKFTLASQKHKTYAEKYPVASTIELPRGTPKAQPRIQHDFTSSKETTFEQTTRLERLKAVRQATIFTWKNYKLKAWKHDEIKPVSGKFADPFGSWAATLIDSLDTLYIMDMQEEFADAVAAVADIDFTSYGDDTLPLFEVTIRYLGGLLGAYDISEGKHRILLDKAVELADHLLGAFDTPNRMPETMWNPRSQDSGRASSYNKLAELGTLSLEFTRLAQLTKEAKYYDAVARITTAFEDAQAETKIPGLWPVFVDASGCKPAESSTDEKPRYAQTSKIIHDDSDDAVGDNKAATKSDKDATPLKGKVATSGKAVDKAMLTKSSTPDDDLDESSEKSYPPIPDKVNKLGRRQLVVEESLSINMQAGCVPQALIVASNNVTDTYTLGSMADSTYEYLPKQHVLLGGLEASYRDMYIDAITAATKYLLFRPMTPTNEDILFAGAVTRDNDNKGDFSADVTHLTCFAGGMYAYGGRLFGRPSDVELGKKLTEGCVWAYKAMHTGLMPEDAVLSPCRDKACEWDEQQVMKDAKAFQARASTESEGKHKTSSAAGEKALPVKTKATSTAIEDADVESDITTATNPKKTKQSKVNIMHDPESKRDVTPNIDGDVSAPKSSDRSSTASDSADFLVGQRHMGYKLRPEAIESVFYMYRITGDAHWREAGWTMFQAITKATRTEYGYSAIDDVSSATPELLDSTESFWLAETLKYFYLLFADEDVVSLDQWVLNTEAHPFRRPDFVKKE